MVALKKELPKAELFAYDVSEEALEVALENARKNKLKVSFSKVDILSLQSLNK